MCVCAFVGEGSEWVTSHDGWSIAKASASFLEQSLGITAEGDKCFETFVQRIVPVNFEKAIIVKTLFIYMIMCGRHPPTLSIQALWKGC